jgi:predicted exporter
MRRFDTDHRELKSDTTDQLAYTNGQKDRAYVLVQATISRVRTVCSAIIRRRGTAEVSRNQHVS